MSHLISDAEWEEYQTLKAAAQPVESVTPREALLEESDSPALPRGRRSAGR
jgi:hypothetical protein